MDDASLLLVRSIWPDVAEPFSRVVPDGGLLVRTLDDWQSGPPTLRIRALDFARGPACPELDDLLEEAAEDAQRRGWTPLDEEPAEGARALEIEGVVLRASIERARPRGPGAVLRVAFHQPWPDDAGAPVETSEAFQLLVRKTLALGGQPSRLVKEVTLDPDDPSRADVVKERVQLPADRRLITRFGGLGFAFDEQTEAWVHRTTAGVYEVVATVREAFASLQVEMVRARIARA